MQRQFTIKKSVNVNHYIERSGKYLVIISGDIKTAYKISDYSRLK